MISIVDVSDTSHNVDSNMWCIVGIFLFDSDSAFTFGFWYLSWNNAKHYFAITLFLTYCVQAVFFYHLLLYRFLLNFILYNYSVVLVYYRRSFHLYRKSFFFHMLTFVFFFAPTWLFEMLCWFISFSLFSFTILF